MDHISKVPVSKMECPPITQKKLGPRCLPNGEIGRMANFDTIMWLFMRFCKGNEQKTKECQESTLLSTSVRMETKSLKCLTATQRGGGEKSKFVKGKTANKVELYHWSNQSKGKP
jgi:hypothetical protein